MWSFRVGRVLDIDVRIHALFLVLLAFIGLGVLFREGFFASMFAVIFVALVFVFVFLHELGHCLTARHYGVRVRDITLWPLGGIASMDHMPKNPRLEMFITLAGPAVNLALAILLSPVAVVTYLLFESLFVVRLLEVNLLLLVFNLLPAFPLDGGRVYRAWLAGQVGYRVGTEKAVKMGQLIAIVVGAIGVLMFNLLLIALAVIIYIAGREEQAMVEAQQQQMQGFFFFHFDAQNYSQPADYRQWAQQLGAAGQHASGWWQQAWRTIKQWWRRLYKKARRWWQNRQAK